jgi:hypothetical protein
MSERFRRLQIFRTAWQGCKVKLKLALLRAKAQKLRAATTDRERISGQHLSLVTPPDGHFL